MTATSWIDYEIQEFQSLRASRPLTTSFIEGWSLGNSSDRCPVNWPVAGRPRALTWPSVLLPMQPVGVIDDHRLDHARLSSSRRYSGRSLPLYALISESTYRSTTSQPRRTGSEPADPRWSVKEAYGDLDGACANSRSTFSASLPQSSPPVTPARTSLAPASP
jgi:hypothetical protein